jgi:hypothetical protein
MRLSNIGRQLPLDGQKIGVRAAGRDVKAAYSGVILAPETSVHQTVPIVTFFIRDVLFYFILCNICQTYPTSSPPFLPKTLTMPKATTLVSAAREARRHNPLEVDVTASGPLKSKPEKRKSRHQDEGDQFVDSKASRKILRMGQDLADEDEEQNKVQKPNPAFDFDSRIEIEEEEYEEFEEWGNEEEDVEETELSPADRAMFRRFFPTEEDQLPGTNLADLILEKIAAHEAAQAANGGRPQGVPGPIGEDLDEIPEKVAEVYTKYASSAVDFERMLILIQSWSAFIKVQIRKTTKSFQNSSDSSSLGGYHRDNTTRSMDSQRMLRSNQDLCFE